MKSTNVDIPPPDKYCHLTRHTNDNIPTTRWWHITIQSPDANDNSNHHTDASTLPDPPCVYQENEHEDCQTGNATV